jgi:hypothetical protein
MAVGSSIGGQGFSTQADIGEYVPQGHPYAMHVMNSMPKWYATAGTTGFRGSNTILSGGFVDRFNDRHVLGRRFFGRSHIFGDRSPMSVGHSVQNNNIFRPRTWTRFGSQDMFFEDPMEGAIKNWNPFQFAPGVVNWAAKHEVFGTAAKEATMKADGKFVGGGLFSQLTASERLRGMSSVDATTQKWLGKYLERSGQPALMGADLSNPMAARTALLQSLPGPGGQYVGGYVNALRSPGRLLSADAKKLGISDEFRSGTVAARRALIKYGGLGEEQIAGKIGMRVGAEAISSAVEGFGVKAGLSTATALGVRGALSAVPYVNVAMWALTAYDITKALVPGSAKFATDAFRSYQGWGSRGTFGAPFKTNEASLTSRSRGVAAIQNSRLNARSVLGSEAGGMSAYFG